MLWQPIAWSSSIIPHSRAGLARSPRTCHEMSWFWQFATATAEATYE
jgi:hypothetical protein